MIDLVLRCITRARWLAFAQNQGIIDTNGVAQPGFDVDEVGNFELTPAVYDSNLVLVTPATYDTWWLVDIRLSHGAASNDSDTLYPGEVDTGVQFTKSKFVRFVRDQATPVTLLGMRAYQFGTGAQRIQLIDSRDLASPKRMWLGGMSF